MKKNYIYSLAATFITAALTLGSFTACSNEDLVTDVNTTQAKTYTVSIPASMGEDGTTRAVDFSGTDLVSGKPTAISSFKTTDKIYVYNQSKTTMLTGYLTPSTDGKTCDLTGSLTGDIAAGDNLVLLYNLSNFDSTDKDNCYFFYDHQNGTQAGVIDGAKATVTVDNNTGGVLTTKATAQFQNVQSMFRFQFASNGTPLSVKSVDITSNSNGIAMYYCPLKDADKYFCYGGIFTNLSTATTDPIYVAMCIDESKSAGDLLTFEVIEPTGVATGNLYRTTKAAPTTPTNGFVNGKYYYNSNPIDLGAPVLQLVKPDLNRSDGGNDSELTDAVTYRCFYIKSPSKSGAGAAQGITMSMSGTSTGYWFVLDGDNSNTVNISGITATFDKSADYIDSYNSLTLNISGDNTITCKNFDYCVSADGNLKLSGNGTLTVTAKSITDYGLDDDNYDGWGDTYDPSALAADGYTVTRSATQDNGDGTYTWMYTVGHTINLSSLNSDYEAQNGDVLTGTLDGSTQPYKISIADGATVTLDGVTINGVNDGDNYPWAGINCEGNATIILKDGTSNVVKGFRRHWPGIYIAENKTLTIQGNTGTLTASPFNGGGSSGSFGAGIGGGGNSGPSCGNIVIEGGVITATGGLYAAGIGAGASNSCGNITISGGTVTAYGNGGGAGIGCGDEGASCGSITISGGSVIAYGNSGGAGIGCGYKSSCGSITISGTSSVTASCASDRSSIGGAGIGSGCIGHCGDITISTSGTVNATGGTNAAGIGSGGRSVSYSLSDQNYCGNISITGGTITAEGKGFGAGIGSGYNGASCGTITIGSGIISVSAKSNHSDAKCIGAGLNGTCGEVTIADGLSINGPVSNGTRVITHP